MAIVQSAGELQALVPAWTPTYTYGSMRLYNDYYRTYAALYREQPNVRVCVDFLARNIAQLGLHTFRRVSDTDRQRLTDHPLARIIARPLPAEFKLTRYRLVETLMSDLGIYFNAYLLKVRIEGSVMGLLPIPPELVTPQGGLVVKGYEIDLGAKRLKLAPGDVVHFRGYNPENRIAGLSPLETLRRVLAEEHAAGDYREFMWRNKARMEGIVERPAEAPEWSDVARNRFREEFGALYSGEEASGTTAVLEDGMTWKPVAFNSQQAEYLGGRKLTREECARAFHIPLPLVGILDNATFSNIREQHKHLYADCLGPWLAMLEEDLALQLLPDFADSDDVYLQFNIQEKLEGSFEEQAASFSTAVGRPYMTADEARARMNLPSLGGDAARLVTPLNVLVGGQASPRDSAPEARALLPASSKADTAGIDGYRPEYRRRHEEKWAEVLARHYRRQEAAVLSRLPKALTPGPSPEYRRGEKVDVAGVWWDEERWNAELGADLFRLNNLTAEDWAKAVAAAAGAEVDPDQMLGWLSEHSRIQAEQINGQMRDELEQALNAPDPLEAVKALFLAAATTWAWRQAQTGVGTAANFGAAEGARAGGLKSKTWRTNSQKPRASHAAMAGVTVEIGKLFPNGMRWPGDPAGGAEEVANCQCSVVFNK